MSKSILCTGRRKADVLVDLSYLYIFFVFFYFPYSCNFLLLSKYIATNIVAFISLHAKTPHPKSDDSANVAFILIHMEL